MAAQLKMTRKARRDRARRREKLERPEGATVLRQVLPRGRPTKWRTLRWARELYERGYDEDVILQSLSRYRDIAAEEAVAAIRETTEYMTIGIICLERGYFSCVRKRARGPLSLAAAIDAFAEMAEDAELLTAHEPRIFHLGYQKTH